MAIATKGAIGRGEVRVAGCSGVVDEWHLDFHKGFPAQGIGSSGRSGSDEGVLPSPARSQSDDQPRARTPSPSGRYPPPPVPAGGRTPLRRRPVRRRPRGGPPRGQGGLERPDLHPTGHPLGLPRPGAQRRPVLPRRGRAADRPPRLAGAGAVQLRDGGLLPGAEAPARAILRRRGPPRGAEPRCASGFAVALEGPPRLPVRRVDGLHARHPGEPARVPSDLQPGSRDVLRSRSDRGHHLAFVWCDPQPGHLPLRRQGSGGGQPAAPVVGRAPPRRRAAGRPPDVGLGRHVPAQAARGRHRQPPVGAPPGRLPQGEAPGQGRSPGRVEEADVDPLGGPGRRTTRCPTRSPSARSASAWSSRGSGPGRSSS